MKWRIFYSYAHADAEQRGRLSTYLAPLVHQGRIKEWYDREIAPGVDWDNEISSRLQDAHLILLLISENFLASEYCFGVELEAALGRLKSGQARVVPVLLKPCLWEESRFSELQIIPRDARPITAWPSQEDAYLSVAKELRDIVTQPAPAPASSKPALSSEPSESLALVKAQILAYARLYERIRQMMQPSHARTRRMEDVFQRMKGLATAYYPLLKELALSPLPGDRLAAVAVLQVFASADHLSFLVERIASEKPFVGYHAARALQFAVGAVPHERYADLGTAIQDAERALAKAEVGSGTDRAKVLNQAGVELADLRASVAAPDR